MRARRLGGDRLQAHLCGEVRDQHRDDGEEDECGDVGGVGDGEGVGRGQEEEVVDERPRCHREERWPEAEAHRDADDRGQEDEVERLDPDQRLDELHDAKGGNDGEQRHGVRHRVDAPAGGPRAHGL